MLKFKDLKTKIKSTQMAKTQSQENQNNAKPANRINFSDWKKNNLDTNQRKNLTKEALDELKQRFQAENRIQKQDQKAVEDLVTLAGSNESLKNNNERLKFFARVEMRLTVLLVLLIRSKKLDFIKITESGIQDVITDVARDQDTLRIKSGSGERPLNPQEKNILKIAAKLPSHHIPVVKNEWKAITKELVENTKAMDFSTGIAIAQARGQKPKQPENLSKEDKGLWNKVKKTYQRQHPIVKGIALVAGTVGMIEMFSWIGGKLFGGGRKVPGQKTLTQPIAAPKEGIFESTWKWGKRVLGLSAVTIGGPFVAGLLLRTSVGESVAAKLFGIKDVNKNRVTKALILFSQMKFAEGLLLIKKGPDQKEEFHKRVAEKLGIKEQHTLLWQIGNLDFRTFSSNTTRSKTAMALGTFGSILGFIPGISRLIDSKEIKDQERTLLKTINEIIAQKKLKIPANATVDQVLELIDKAIEKGSMDDRTVSQNLSKQEKSTLKRQEHKEKRKQLQIAVIASKVEKEKTLSAKEQSKLIDSVKSLISDTENIQKAIPKHWDTVLKSMNELKLIETVNDWLKSTGVSLPGQPTIKPGQRIDFIEANKQLVHLAKKEESKKVITILSTLNNFKTLVGNLTIGKKINDEALKEFKRLKERIYGKNGYAALIKRVLRQANASTTANYKEYLKKNKKLGGWKIAKNSCAILVYGTLGILQTFLEKPATGAIIVHGLYTGSGLVWRGKEALQTGGVTLQGAISGNASTQKLGRIRTIWHRGTAPVRWTWNFGKGIFEAAINRHAPSTRATASGSSPLTYDMGRAIGYTGRKLKEGVSTLRASYTAYRTQATAAGTPTNSILSFETFTKHLKPFEIAKKSVNIVFASILIQQIARAQDKKKATIDAGVILGSSLLGRMLIGSGTDYIVGAGVGRLAGVAAGIKFGKVAGVIGAFVGAVLGATFGAEVCDSVSKWIYRELNLNPITGGAWEAGVMTLDIATGGPAINAAGKMAVATWRHFFPKDSVGNFYSFMLDNYTGIDMTNEKTGGWAWPSIKKFHWNTAADYNQKINEAQKRVKEKLKVTKSTDDKRKLEFLYEQLERQKPMTLEWQQREAYKHFALKSKTKLMAEAISKKIPEEVHTALGISKKRVVIMLTGLEQLSYEARIEFWKKHQQTFDRIVDPESKQKLLGLYDQLDYMQQVFKRIGFNPKAISKPNIKKGFEDMMVFQVKYLDLTLTKTA